MARLFGKTDQVQRQAQAKPTGGTRMPWHAVGSTTGVGGGHGQFVGRIAGEDCFSGETGAERRAMYGATAGR